MSGKLCLSLRSETEINDEDFPFALASCAREVLQAGLLQEDCPIDVSIDLLLTDDAGIQKLNDRMRGIDRSTDVLSFPAINFLSPGDFDSLSDEDKNNTDPESGALVLGDVAISVPTLLRQAGEYGHSSKREFAFLLTHSLLHLLGYDHLDQVEERRMLEKQEMILSNLQIRR